MKGLVFLACLWVFRARDIVTQYYTVGIMNDILTVFIFLFFTLMLAMMKLVGVIVWELLMSLWNITLSRPIAVKIFSQICTTRLLWSPCHNKKVERELAFSTRPIALNERWKAKKNIPKASTRFTQHCSLTWYTRAIDNRGLPEHCLSRPDCLADPQSHPSDVA